MAPHWTGANGQHLGVEIPLLLRVFGGSSCWSSLSSGPSWGTGLSSASRRTIGLGRGVWLTPSLASMALPRFRTPLSGLHGLARGPRRYPRHYWTSDWLIFWVCSPSWQTFDFLRQPGMRGSGVSLCGSVRRLLKHSKGI